MGTKLKRHRLLNDLIGVYKKNFNTEVNNLSDEQTSLAAEIANLAAKVNRSFEETPHFNKGLTTIKVCSQLK